MNRLLSIMLAIVVLAAASVHAENGGGEARPVNPFADPGIQNLISPAQPSATLPVPPAPPAPVPANAGTENAAVGPKNYRLDQAMVLYVIGNEAMLLVPRANFNPNQPAANTMVVRHNEPAFLFERWVLPEVQQDSVLLYAIAPPAESKPAVKDKKLARGEAIWYGRIEITDNQSAQNGGSPPPATVGPAMVTPSVRAAQAGAR